jgi:hypothetical protein
MAASPLISKQFRVSVTGNNDDRGQFERQFAPVPLNTGSAPADTRAPLNSPRVRVAAQFKMDIRHIGGVE